jgi:hypothetical protein
MGGERTSQDSRLESEHEAGRTGAAKGEAQVVGMGGRTVATALLVVLVVVVLCWTTEEALGLGFEKWGNEPLDGQPEYAPGVLGLLNLESRVYWRWVNGNENAYFRGDTEARNEALKKFAAVEAPVREIILRPGPGEVNSFHGDRDRCDWRLQVPTGLYLSHVREEEGTEVRIKHATMTVFAGGGNVELERVEMPPGVTVLEVTDILQRCVAGLGSGDHAVRKDAAYLLAELAPLEGAILPLIGALADEHRDVRSQAAVSLGRFGIRAAAALPLLRRALEDSSAGVRQGCEQAIARIEESEDEKAKQHRALRQRIHTFRESLPRETGK